jgi:hypothetical protein
MSTGRSEGARGGTRDDAFETMEEYVAVRGMGGRSRSPYIVGTERGVHMGEYRDQIQRGQNNVLKVAIWRDERDKDTVLIVGEDN